MNKPIKLIGSIYCIFSCWLAPSNASALNPQPKPGDPIANLSDVLLERFNLGKVAFETDISLDAGLGPIFNQTSCASCHNNPVGGAGNQTVTRFGQIDKKGGFNPLELLGGSLLQAQSLNEDCAESIPNQANVTSLRVTNGALAFGLIEAISDESLITNQKKQPGVTRGKTHMVLNLEDDNGNLHVGRFGWKAQVASILTFSADAAQNEMGLSNRLIPFDNAPNGDEKLLEECDTVLDPEDIVDANGFGFIDRVTDFQRLLAPPPQTPYSGMTGEVIFNKIGCAICHTPSFVTGNNPETIEPLRKKFIKPYSDFLLHNMGIAGDGITQGDANGLELKTPPLWGLTYRNPLWHDGRFSGGTFESRVTDAIEEHGVFGSQGIPAADAFTELSAFEKEQLISFLKSLGQVEFDSDNDGDVELNDFHGYVDTIGFKNCFETYPSPDDDCAIHDVDQDGDVDLDDFDIFLVAYDDILNDCNNNGIADLLDILLGASDEDNNGVIDDCQNCLGDLSGDMFIGVSDLLAIMDAWGSCQNCSADINDDGQVNVSDLLYIVGNWGPCL